MLLRAVVLAAAASAAGAAHARGVSPYLPLDRSPEIERQIERLMILADAPVLSRPLAAATVFDALPDACALDALLCEQVRNYLSGYMKTAGLTHASLAAGAGSDDAGPGAGAPVPLPNRHGMTSDSAYELSAHGFIQPSDYLIVNLGVLAYEDETVPTGSVVSLGNQYVQLDVGYRDHWLSPMTESPMLIGTQAQTMPSVTLSNYTPLTRFGFRYEIFAARMSESDRIRHAGGFTSGNPRLVGMHLSIQPLPGFSLGLNRLMQYGGGERGGRSFGDLIDALFRPSQYDNVSPDLERDEEFGNQLASITSRFTVPGPLPFSVYFEYAGEDTSMSNDFHLGNAALSGGVHFPRLWNDLDVTVELSEWQNGWYVHGIYQDGLRHEGRVIGHWGGDWRAGGDGVGARSAMLRAGWTTEAGGLVEATYRALDNENYTATDYERAHHLNVRYSRRWRAVFVGGELDVGRDVFGETYSRVSAFLRY